MNSFLLGLLVAVVFFVVIGVVFYCGYRFGNKYKQSKKINEDDQTEIKRLEELQKGFVKIMNYDVDTALGRKKV